MNTYNMEDFELYIDPVAFYDKMIEFPVMSTNEIPDSMKERINQTTRELLEKFKIENNLTDINDLDLVLSIRMQVYIMHRKRTYAYVVVIGSDGYKYDYVSKDIVISHSDDCFAVFEQCYMEKLRALFFGDIKDAGGYDDD